MANNSKLTTEQVQSVVEWMNTWEQLKDTAIPIRFKEDFTNVSGNERCSLTNEYLSLSVEVLELVERGQKQGIGDANIARLIAEKLEKRTY